MLALLVLNKILTPDGDLDRIQKNQSVFYFFLLFTILDISWKCNQNLSLSFWVELLTGEQANRHTDNEQQHLCLGRGNNKPHMEMRTNENNRVNAEPSTVWVSWLESSKVNYFHDDDSFSSNCFITQNEYHCSDPTQSPTTIIYTKPRFLVLSVQCYS